MNENLEILKTPSCNESLQAFYEIANSTLDVNDMLSTLAVIHTEYDAFTIEDIVNGFLARASVDENEQFKIWDQAFSGTIDEHGLMLYYNSYLSSSKSVQNKHFRNIATTTYINLGSDETREITQEYARQIISGVNLDENGIPVEVNFLDYLTLQAGLNQNYDSMSYVMNHLVDKNNPHAVDVVINELEGNQLYSDLERLIQNQQVGNVLLSAQSSDALSVEKQNRYAELAKLFVN